MLLSERGQGAANAAGRAHPARARILGQPVDLVTTAETVTWIASAVARRRKAMADGARQDALQLVTLNPEMVMAARRDPQLRAAIQAADLVVADGAGVVAASRLLGCRLPERVTGIDLLEAAAARAAMAGMRLFLLGAAPGVAARAAERLSARHHGLRIAGTLAGSPDAAAAEETLRAVEAAQVDVLFVGFGSPAQERWIAEHRSRLPVAVALGVGGALDFAAGVVPRAPAWMRRHGLEWLYRLWRQPWRWRRMMALPRFAAAVLGQVATERVRDRNLSSMGRETPR